MAEFAAIISLSNVLYVAASAAAAALHPLVTLFIRSKVNATKDFQLLLLQYYTVLGNQEKEHKDTIHYI